jgi:branched-chain amino acid transport system permease protein
VLLGGLESIGGAMVGGIVIGLAQTWADLLFGSDAGTQLAPYVILMVVLIVRPDGLFGQKRIERI